EGGERGRFSGSGRAGHEHEAARLAGEGLDDGGEAELVEIADLKGDGAEGAGDRAALTEDISAEAAEAFDPKGEVDAAVTIEERALLRVQELEAERLGMLGAQMRDAEWDELSVDPKLRRGAGRQVEIGRALLEHRLEELTHGEIQRFIL